MSKLLRDALIWIFSFLIVGGLLDSIGVKGTVFVVAFALLLYFGWGLLFNLKGHRK